MIDSVTATVRKLKTLTNVIAALGALQDSTPWVFQWKLPDNVEVSNSGKVAIIVTSPGDWASMNLHNTERFPRIDLRILADGERDPDTNILTKRSAFQRALDLDRLLTDHLHKPWGPSAWWTDDTGLKVHSSRHLVGGERIPIEYSDGSAQLVVSFGLNTA